MAMVLGSMCVSLVSLVCAQSHCLYLDSCEIYIFALQKMDLVSVTNSSLWTSLNDLPAIDCLTWQHLSLMVFAWLRGLKVSPKSRTWPRQNNQESWSRGDMVVFIPSVYWVWTVGMRGVGFDRSCQDKAECRLAHVNQRAKTVEMMHWISMWIITWSICKNA